MPLPSPRGQERKDDFIQRCMGDEEMVDEFNNPRVRRGVCESRWERAEDDSDGSDS